MQNKLLHIISFDNPFPTVYGGVIDVFFKIKALHKQGYKIHLHCFISGLSEVSAELKGVTDEVYFYKKNRNPFFIFSSIPLSVISRFDKSLVDNILKIDAPILFEGLQTTMLLNINDLANRKKYLRLHNLEADYYSGIYKSETNWIKKALYFFEAYKYKAYQNSLNKFDKVFTLSVYENEYVKAFSANAAYVPVFHGNQAVKQLSKWGEYAFYHGDMRLADNKKAAAFLITIFKKIDYKLVIASSNGEDFIEQLAEGNANITFIKLEADNQLEQLLEKAHINVMLSFQRSGTKLKLVNSLFNSRFCLINKNMVDDPRLMELCELAETEKDFIDKIWQLKNIPYDNASNRTIVLNKVLDNSKNARLISSII